tara:strand:- start:92 stop:268 length:177 start_codon:yes stop_codon:yes gene_type:complete
MWHRIKNLFTVQPVVEEQKQKRFNPSTRIEGDKLTDKEKMDKGFNGSTYSINGRDVDF